MMHAALRPSNLVAVVFGAAFLLSSAAPVLALGFTVHDYDLGERIELTDGRRLWTAELEVELGDRHGTSFCVDVDTEIGKGHYVVRDLLDATTASSPAGETSRDFSWAGQVMSHYGRSIDGLVEGGITRAQAITGVQAAIWEGIYKGDTVKEESLSTGAREIFQRILSTPLADLGSPEVKIVELDGHQDQVFASPVPEPTAALVFGAGMLVAGAAVRRPRR